MTTGPDRTTAAAARRPGFALNELVECAERELRMRKRVYPKWVSQARMSAAEANREIDLMAEIVRRLRMQMPEQDGLFGR